MSPRDDPRIFEPGYYRRLFEIERDHWWARGMRRAMHGLLRRPLAGRRDLRILDVGCGTGYLLEQARRWPLGGKPVGVDLSLHALRFCRKGGATLAAASAPDLPFTGERFDLVFCVDTLQHLSPAGADRRAMGELARVLAPGGVLYLRTNSARGHRKLRGADPALYRRYDRRGLAELASSAGLRVERVTYLNCVPGLWGMVKELATPRAGRVAAAGPALAIRPLPRGLAWLGPALRGVLAAEAWWVGAARRDLPFGHSLALVARRPG